MKDLPSSWRLATFSKVFGPFQYGLTAKAKPLGDGIRFLRITDIQKGNIHWESVPSCEEVSDDTSRYRLQDGDFVFARAGSVEKAARIIDPPEAVFASYLIRATPLNKEHADWLGWFIRSPLYLEQIGRAAAGIGMPNVNASKISSFVLPLPPLAEQNQIVAKLAQCFSRTKIAREELAHIPQLAERYRRILWDLAFSGVLTNNWRERFLEEWTGDNLLQAVKTARVASSATAKEKARIEEAFRPSQSPPGPEELGIDRSLPNSWIACRIGHIGTVGNGSTPSRANADYWKGSIPWVSSGEVRNNVITETRERITQAGYDSSSVRLLPKGAVLLAMIGEGKTRGQTALLEIEATINQNIAAVVGENSIVLPEFIWWWFRFQYHQTRRRGAGNGPKALNCQAVRELPFVLPPLAEQREIVSILSAAFRTIDLWEQEVARSQYLLDRFEQSILSKAFLGELVPQNPNDTPVPEFLSAINDTLAVHPTPRPFSKARIPRIPKEKAAMTKSRQDEDVNEKPYLANLLRELKTSTVEDLFRRAELPVADFYKQLAWEVQAGHIKDHPKELEAA